MDTVWKDKWLAAMSSGNYKFGTGRLRDNEDCFCALGVLADLLVKEGKATWLMHTDTGYPQLAVPDGLQQTPGDGIARGGSLHLGLLKEVGMSPEEDGYYRELHQENVINVNDVSTNYNNVIDYVKDEL